MKNTVNNIVVTLQGKSAHQIFDWHCEKGGFGS